VKLLEAVVFDLDGVLMESTPWHAQAYQEVLAGAGVAGFSYARYAGMRTRDVMGMIGAEHGMGWEDGRLGELSAAKTRRALELISANRPVVAGCEELVRTLAGRYRVGLASSASRESVSWFLQTTGLENVFGVVLTGNDVKEAKPSPEIYLRAIAALGASEWLVVEDAAAGVLAGRAAGARVWAVLTSSGEEELRAAGAERCFADLGELGKALLI
jgi:beta-phosphoglucomutase